MKKDLKKLSNYPIFDMMIERLNPLIQRYAAGLILILALVGRLSFFIRLGMQYDNLFVMVTRAQWRPSQREIQRNPK